MTTLLSLLSEACSSLLQQLWVPTTEDAQPQDDALLKPCAAPVLKPSLPVVQKPTRQCISKKQRKHNKQQLKKPMMVGHTLPERKVSNGDCVSDASTCGSSDEEEEEDLGVKEMKLMMERAQQIKRLRFPQRKQVTKQQVAAPRAVAYAPVRLQNTTNELWNWSVYSGFAVDRMTQWTAEHYEETDAEIDAFALEDAERLQALALGVLDA